MEEFIVESLEPIKYPLVNKFYQEFKVRGRAKSHDLVWVLKQGSQILAVAKVVPVEQYSLLSGVFTHPNWRGKKLATQLVKTIIASHTKPIYTFAYTHLSTWYHSLGFKPDKAQAELAALFLAYRQQGRDICCMVADKELR